MSRAAPCLVAWVALAGAAPMTSPDRDPSRLRAGLFLYAAPGQADPRFAESVVLLVKHEAEGSMGLVVNRPTDVSLQEALKGIGESAASDLPLWWGGPVQPEAIFALVRSPPPGSRTQTVMPGVHLTGDLDDVRAALSDRDPGSGLRVYSGYTGWAAGQLRAEVRRGTWILDRADASSVFAADPSELWQRVYLILERLEVRGFRPRAWS
jgi:putative transcriptional regulator